MVYYVVYNASKDYSNRSLIPARLRVLGCRQINKAFWEFDREKTHKVLKLLEKNHPLTLRRSKEINKRLIASSKVLDLGSLIIVTFKAPKDKKERIRSFIRRTPCIRLCRLVYAFYQRHTQFDPEKKLIDAQGLATIIRELDGEVKLIPKIVVLNERSIQRLVEETKEHVEKEIHAITSKCKRIHDKCIRNECDHKRMREVLRGLRRRYVRTRRRARFYSAWMALDFSKDMMKAYKALLRLRNYSREERIGV